MIDMTQASDLAQARRALDRLRPTQSLVVNHLCQEDQVVLRAEGYRLDPSPLGWIVRR